MISRFQVLLCTLMFMNITSSNSKESESMLIVMNLIPYLWDLSNSFATASFNCTTAKLFYQQPRSQGFSFEGKWGWFCQVK